MGYYTRFGGELRIEPPVPWSRLRNSDWLRSADRIRGRQCVWIDYTEEVEDTDEGQIVRRRGDRLVFCEERHTHSGMVSDVQAIVDEIGNEHEFRGRVECEGEDAADVWRLKVIGGKVREFRPEIVWPQESE